MGFLIAGEMQITAAGGGQAFFFFLPVLPPPPCPAGPTAGHRQNVTMTRRREKKANHHLRWTPQFDSTRHNWGVGILPWYIQMISYCVGC